MTLLTQQQAREFGIALGYQMAIESGSADAPSEGWDAILINANPKLVRERLGWDRLNISTEATGLLQAYCDGCQAGANIAIEVNSTDCDECEYEVQDEQSQVLARTTSERTALLHARTIRNSRVVMHIKSGTHESSTVIYPCYIPNRWLRLFELEVSDE